MYRSKFDGVEYSYKQSMNKQEFFQAMTLWFVAIIFLQTSPENGGTLVLTISLIAGGIMYLIPFYLILVLVSKLRGR
jgi:uncharacterized membrane protein YjjP (DUF1212 family)